MGSAIYSTYRIQSLQTCQCSSQVEVGWGGSIHQRIQQQINPQVINGERKYESTDKKNCI